MREKSEILLQLSGLLDNNTDIINQSITRIAELEQTITGQLESINLLKESTNTRNEEIIRLNLLLEQKEINSNRLENHVQKLALRCAELTERCSLSKIKDPGVSEWEQIKNKTISKLTAENLKLFKKIGDERIKFTMEIEHLKRQLGAENKQDGCDATSSATSEIPTCQKQFLPETLAKTPVETKQLKDKPVSDKDNTLFKSTPIVKMSKSPGPKKIIDVPSSPLDHAKETRLKRSVSSATRPTFKYQEVVRDKETRRKMHGRDCPCCADYYRLTANLQPFKELGVVDKDRRQVISRHREWSKRPDTPPWYWDVDFPTTQEIESTRKKRRSS
ncbi:hypothetical protein HDV01_005622 [Terramyces sp. JEL0728]|nr:hypothetical protein HDV01_005622 [Terramyces sp. JEL0728]